VPMMWIVREVGIESAIDLPMPGEPFAVMRDDDGDLFVLYKEQVEISADPAKATETAGTLAQFPD